MEKCKVIRVYDFRNHCKAIQIPEDKEIEKIEVTIMFGDEVGQIVYTDGTRQNFDASDTPRIMDMPEGHYTVPAERIADWQNFFCRAGHTAAYARKKIMEQGKARWHG